VFCGGTEPATTVEHCPPKSLFQFKRWPESFEFPACNNCNGGTGDQDAVIAMLGRMHPDEDTGNADGRIEGLIRNVNTQFPGVIHKMMPSHIEARRRNRALGLKPGPGQLHQDIAPVSIPDEINEAVGTFSLKLSKAIYYREAHQAFPSTGTVIMHWFTNVELVRHGKYVLFEHLQSLSGHAPQLVRGRKFLNDQFEYKVSLSDDRQILVLQVRIGQSFGMIIYASIAPGVLEEAMSKLRAKYQRTGPFDVLQSPGGA
jgi:hypothetical protein